MKRDGRSAAANLALLVFALGAAARTAALPSPEKTPTHKRSAGAKDAPSKPTGPESRYRGAPISLDLKDADLKDVLRTFAQLAKVNIAIDPEVKGSVTIRLHDVPWDQALDVILRTNGFGYVLEGNVLRVGLPAKLAGG